MIGLTLLLVLKTSSEHCLVDVGKVKRLTSCGVKHLPAVDLDFQKIRLLRYRDMAWILEVHLDLKGTRRHLYWLPGEAKLVFGCVLVGLHRDVEERSGHS